MMEAALIIGGILFVMFIFSMFGDRSIQNDECQCDYSGGVCNKCMAEVENERWQRDGER